MTDVQSVGANATVENVLAGKLHEFLSVRSLVRVMATAAAVGLNLSVLIGGEALVQDQEMSDANHFPVYPDDISVEGAGYPGDRITVSVRNTTGAALTSNIVVDTIPA